MRKPKYFIIYFFLILTETSFGQNICSITIDTTKILSDKNLDGFLSNLKTETFQTFTNKNQIPKFINEYLNCLAKDKFSLANPDQSYRCCCTSPLRLPKRKLLFFSISKEVFLITYLTGGIGVSTTILMLKLENEKIIDLWTGWGFSNFTSIEEVIKHIEKNRNKEFRLHSNFISL